MYVCTYVFVYEFAYECISMYVCSIPRCSVSVCCSVAGGALRDIEWGPAVALAYTAPGRCSHAGAPSRSETPAAER